VFVPPQISLTKSSCKFALNGLKNWMKPEKVFICVSTSATPACSRHVYFSSCCHCFAAGLALTFWKSFVVQIPASITTFPSSAQIVPEPLGVVLIISAWNYPFSKLMSLSCKSFFQIEIDGSPASSLKKTPDKVVIKQFVVA